LRSHQAENVGERDERYYSTVDPERFAGGSPHRVHRLWHYPALTEDERAAAVTRSAPSRRANLGDTILQLG